MTTSASGLVEQLNARHGTSYRPVAHHAGWQGGALELLDASGARVLLTSTPAVGQRLARLRSTRAVIDDARRRAAYPAARILLIDASHDGQLYWLQEWLPGTPMGALTSEHLDWLLELHERQAGLNPQTEQDWSDYVRRVVFEGESGWSDLLRCHSAETRDLLGALAAAAAPRRGLILPTNDLVHGDLNLGNVLVSDGRISGVIDAASIGKGSRAIDLAIQLTYAYVDGADAGLRTRLWQRILAIRGPDTLVVGLVYGALAVVAFAIEHHGPDGTADMVRRAWPVVDDLRAADLID